MADLKANSDRIHGYNNCYVVNDKLSSQYECFELLRGKPQQFEFHPVDGSYTPSTDFPNKVLDHQGHIVPQNKLIGVLDPIAKAASDHFKAPNSTEDLTLENLGNYLNKEYSSMNFDKVTKYIKDVLMLVDPKATEAIFVNKDETGIDERVGGYFSVLVWNPVNICRAPEDKNRSMYPGQAVDDEVRQFIINNSTMSGIKLSTNMKSAFKLIDNSSNNAELKSFISACNAELINNINQPKGYYQFVWKQKVGTLKKLIPG